LDSCGGSDIGRRLRGIGSCFGILELGLNGIFLGLNGIDFFGIFITDFYRFYEIFTDFFYFQRLKSKKICENLVKSVKICDKNPKKINPI
jgi:hypothetical protein